MTAPPRTWPFVSTLGRWYRNWNTAREGAFELQCAGAAEVERIAQELGLSSFELQNLVKRPDAERARGPAGLRRSAQSRLSNLRFARSRAAPPRARARRRF